MFPKKLAGVKRKDMMTFEEADGTKPNPKINEDYSYMINCQTCVVAYEARRRGYDVDAKGNFLGSLSETKMVTTYQGVKYTTSPQFLEVENYEFNIEVVDEILRKASV